MVRLLGTKWTLLAAGLLSASLLTVGCTKQEGEAVSVKKPASDSRPAGASAAKEPLDPNAPFDARAKLKNGAATWSFEGRVGGPDQRVGGWLTAETNGAGKLAKWRVTRDPRALAGENVLSLVTGNSGQTYNLITALGVKSGDFHLMCGVRGNFGKEDQGGGPVWRFLDQDNYYVCRINPLEDNFRVYKVVGGERTELASAEHVSEPNTWYRVRVSMVGDRIRCYVDGVELLDVTDATFQAPGAVGFWSKADASTSFDGLLVNKAGG